jgi:multiple sugar transport system ATP-binding protein
MADRIAVMNDGIIRQLGTPIEIFDHPQDEFVAGFIGSPPMNVVDCRLHMQNGSYAINLEGFMYAIPDQVGKKMETSEDLKNGEVRLGIRPEDVSVSPPKGKKVLSGNVSITEPVGESVVYHIGIGENLELLAEVQSEAAVNDVGDNVEVTFDPERLHFFHPETGKALYT